MTRMRRVEETACRWFQQPASFTISRRLDIWTSLASSIFSLETTRGFSSHLSRKKAGECGEPKAKVDLPPAR